MIRGSRWLVCGLLFLGVDVAGSIELVQDLWTKAYLGFRVVVVSRTLIFKGFVSVPGLQGQEAPQPYKILN